MRKNNWKVKVDGRGKSVDEIYREVVASRGVTDIVDFFNPSNSHILAPTMLKNIESAANIVINGINEKKKFLIYADVDADGCTSAAILYHYLNNFEADVGTYINKDKDHGIQSYFELDPTVDILIVVDSINDNPDDYMRILNNGTTVIVLDHHVPKDEILAIQEEIHLVSSANNYPNPYLSGSGVCWKFVNYLDYLLNQFYSLSLVDLAAIGIVADVSSLGPESMENRAMCNQGFQFVSNVGIRELVKKDELCADDIGFTIGPLVNAANRMGGNELALQLFLTTSTKEAKDIIKKLTKLKEQQKARVAELMPMIGQEAQLQMDYKVMFFFPKECGTLAGLLATKACDMYGRPVFVLHSEDPDFYRGSMRASGSIDMRKIINDSGLADCQGHENSAGITIPKQNLQSLSNYLESAFDGVEIDDSVDVDLTVERMQITPWLLKRLHQMNRISGAGFPSISVLIENVKKYQVKPLSQGKHLCIDSADMKFLWWNFNDWDSVAENGSLSAVGRLEESYFAGKRSVQLIMSDYAFEVAPQPTFLW